VGVNGIDVVVRDGQVFVLELNPRYSASMELIERGGALNVFETHVAACGGVLAKTIGAPRDVLGKAVLWARRDIVIGNTRGWLSRDDVRDIPHPGERIRRGHPICTVFARGRDDAACYGELAAGVAAIEQELGLLTKSTTAAAPPR
jgi:predicted ATP-grasp superfamily ATP-dependent carboligase